ncbi:MAG: Ig-like domain-containing protein [Patescibacteria group bacterium]
MKKNIKLPTIVGIVVLILGLGAGIFLLQFKNIFNLKASPDQDPKQVKITNISDKSFSVSWITDKATVGFVSFGESATTLNQTAPDTDDSAKNVHTITVVGLTPNKNYFFKISSDGTLKDNNGIAWNAQTGPTLSVSTNAQIVSGNVVTSTGQPATQALIYLTTSGSSTVSAKVSANGSWVIPLSKLRTSDLQGYPVLTNKTLVEILIQTGTGSIATAQIYLEATNPVPTMSIGQNYDFRNQTPNNISGTNPEANLTLPEDETPLSGLNIATGSPTPVTGSTVTIENVTQGEIVNTTQPEFFGEGPKGTKITIEIHSTQAISGTTTVDSSGNWNWEPPKDLEPGSHTITLKWTDASGILRTLTRSFVVEAAEGPAFVATPSGSPKASPSATPRVTRPATDSGTPVAGVATPTLVMLSLAVSFIAISVFVTKKSFET